ncbi:MAG: hypothetical protein WAL32_00330 [Terriglobales bacterium]
MTIDLKPEQQRVIDLAVKSGAYQNPGEVLDQAFEIIPGAPGLAVFARPGRGFWDLAGPSLRDN